MIKYRYAKNEHGKIVDVNYLNRKQDLGQYYCLGCGHELIPHLGKKKAKHFNHKSVNCSKETYLHHLSKKLFHKSYKASVQKNEPFILEYPVKVKSKCSYFEQEFNVSCYLGEKPKIKKEFNLTSYFTEIELEKRDENLFPDVRIFNPKTNESIYIEIAVTHFSEETKKKSGQRIIEFNIQNESDLQLFSSNLIPLDKEKIKLYNFKSNKSKSDNVCNGDCSTSKIVFLVLNTGEAFLTEIKLKDLKAKIDQNIIIDYKIMRPADIYSGFRYDAYFKNIVKALENGVKIQNCLLCHYHSISGHDAVDPHEMSIFCNYFNSKCKPNKAAQCEHLNINKKSYSEYRNGVE